MFYIQKYLVERNVLAGHSTEQRGRLVRQQHRAGCKLADDRHESTDDRPRFPHADRLEGGREHSVHVSGANPVHRRSNGYVQRLHEPRRNAGGVQNTGANVVRFESAGADRGALRQISNSGLRRRALHETRDHGLHSLGVYGRERVRHQQRRMSPEMYKQSRELRLHVQHGLRVVQGQRDRRFLHRKVRDRRERRGSVSEEQDLRAGHVPGYVRP